MSKPFQQSLASEPDLRQIKPVVVTGFITIGVLMPRSRVGWVSAEGA